MRQVAEHFFAITCPEPLRGERFMGKKWSVHNLNGNLLPFLATIERRDPYHCQNANLFGVNSSKWLELVTAF
jgi:hypothetical protein